MRTAVIRVGLENLYSRNFLLKVVHITFVNFDQGTTMKSDTSLKLQTEPLFESFYSTYRNQFLQRLATAIIGTNLLLLIIFFFLYDLI